MNEIQATSPTGLALYGVIINPAGQWYNTVTPAFEAFNAANWAQYVIVLLEAVANTGFYVGSLPSSPSLAVGLYFFSAYNQAGSSPASTDLQQGLTLVVDWSGTAVNSIAPMPVGPGNTQAAQIPQQQSSLQIAQGILNQLYSAMSGLITGGQFGVKRIMIDGQETEFQNVQQLESLIQFWEKKVALLNGTRKRITGMRMGGYYGSGCNWPGYGGG